MNHRISEEILRQRDLMYEIPRKMVVHFRFEAVNYAILELRLTSLYLRKTVASDRLLSPSPTATDPEYAQIAREIVLPRNLVVTWRGSA